jgi:NAD-dependent histone deacetylase SIR2
MMEKAIREKRVPTCLEESCNGLVKPDIVFFGEQLPTNFFQNIKLASYSDLCIVMGTSLSVHPFAALPSMCEETTPRVLINKEQVGGIGARPDDVLLLGDCDSGVRKLAEACGWLEELEKLWAETAPKDQPKVDEHKPQKTRDEQLQDEIDLITKEVDESLKLGEAQHEWLEKHVGNKASRMNDENKKPETTDAANSAAAAASIPLKETIMHPATPVRQEDAKKQPDEGIGLAHVFPFLKKSAL